MSTGGKHTLQRPKATVTATCGMQEIPIRLARRPYQHMHSSLRCHQGARLHGIVRSSLSWFCACFAADGEEQQATFDSRAAQGIAHFGFLVLLRAVFILAYAPYALCVVAMLEHTVCRLMQKETPISGF